MGKFYTILKQMKSFLLLFVSLSIIILSWCWYSSTIVEYNDDTPIISDTIDDTSKPTVTTEIPTTTSEEIITQADTSL
jgi:hypothetical protein